MKQMSITPCRNLVSMTGLTTAEIMRLIDRAEEFKAGDTINLSQPVYVSNLFFENSTRTHTSFEMAERKLGLTVINFDPQHSSVTKGETLHDTLLTLGALGVDLAVVRHSQDAYYQPLIDGGDLELGIINAGDGSGEHPSQSLLDLMTIRENFGSFGGLNVVICGDIAHSRVARSNAEALYAFGANLYFAGPEEWYDQQFNRWGQFVAIDDVIEDADVMMMLRVQHERHDATADAAFNTGIYHERYGLSILRAGKMKPAAIIMHPGPINRGVELASELVQARQSRFVEQMHNGVFMRMAMLEHVLKARRLGGLE